MPKILLVICVSPGIMTFGGTLEFMYVDAYQTVWLDFKKIYKGMCVSGGKKRSFFGKFGVLCVLVTSVLRFALLPYYRRVVP